MQPLTAQDQSQGGSGAGSAEVAPLSFKYKFENVRFYVPLIEIELAGDGTGAVHFKEGESDDVIDRQVKLLPATVQTITDLVKRCSFLSSSEDYQDKKDFSHLGWMTITVSQGASHRTVRFNYTINREMKQLAEIFRAIGDQAIDLFDMDVAIQHEPLDLPHRLEALEDDLSLGRLAEPEQLIPALRAMSEDDTNPLIARNQAKRIIAAIQKGKYKSPVKLTR
ncbi:MAG TPA: hypothetical protein VJX67_14430 [Blastocatellia bacterium]|nr:hypothetical protein [Blastocatellia bacterium]